MSVEEAGGRTLRDNSEAVEYNAQALSELKHLFPLLSVKAIESVFYRNNESFSEAMTCLSRFDSKMSEQQISAAVGVPASVGKIRLARRRTSSCRQQITNSTLLEEMSVHPFFRARVEPEPPLVEEEPEPEFECGCCFGKFNIEEGVSCTNQEVFHFFDFACVQSHVKNDTFGNNKLGVVKCMSTDGCDGFFSERTLEDVLSPRTQKGRDDHVFRLNMLDAGFSMADCPNCAAVITFEGRLEAVNCLECNVVFCPKCQDPPHPGKSCEEMRKENDRADACNQAAEALTAAIRRACPKCDTPFVKSDGCNKMTCPRCQTKSCFLCRAEIQDYTHFCQKPHCSHENCGKCLLYGDYKEADRKALNEVGNVLKKSAGENYAEIDQLLMSPPFRNNHN